MNPSLFYLILLLFLLLPSQFLMLGQPLYKSHDGLYHVARISQFHQSIIEGQIPPRLAPTILDGAGYPLFVVNYQLPYYLAEIFMQISQDPTFSFKAVMAATFLLSGVFAFLLFKNVGSNLGSLVAAVVFSYLPYRFANLYTRASFGESTAFMFIPLMLLSFHEILKRPKLGVLILSVASFGLITSHTVIFLLFAPFFFLYIFVIVRPTSFSLRLIILGVIWGILLASFQLIPSIFEKTYLKFDQNLAGLYRGHFLNLFQLLRIPASQVNIGTPFQIGASATLVILWSLVLALVKRSAYLLFFLIVIFVSVLATLPLSLPFWENLPLASAILYPWRFTSVIVLATAFLSVYLVDLLKAKPMVAAILVILTLYTSRHYYLASTQIVPNLPTPSLTTQMEYDPIWSTEKTFTKRELVNSWPKAIVSNFNQKPFQLSFTVQAEEKTHFIINKLYFPGWRLQVNHNHWPITIDDGLIAFDLKPGNWQVDLSFGETALRSFANLLTVVSLLLLLFFTAKTFFSI